MPDEQEGMPFVSSIGFSMTTRCPIACPHCIIEAGPHRKEEISITDAEDWIRQAAAYRNGHIKSIQLTGGEPFYNQDLLRCVLDCALSQGMVAAVATNAFWASSLANAMAVLEGVPQVKMLAISADVYHQKTIPLTNVRNAILAAKALGVRYNLATCSENSRDPAFLNFKRQLEDLVEPGLIQVSPVLPAGRARRRFRPEKRILLDEPPVGPCNGADFPTVFPDGRVVGCMALVTELPPAHPLNLGSLKERRLAQILDAAETNVPLQMLRVWGPQSLLARLGEAGCQDRLPRKFLQGGYCDLCYALLTDPELLEHVNGLAMDEELAERTAYARLYYLQEEAMLTFRTKNHLICS